MKRIALICFAAAAVLTLSACAEVDAAYTELIGGASTVETVGTLVHATPEQVQAAMDAAKKGLTAAHQAHRAVADAARVAAETGVLHGQNAATAKDLLFKSEAILEAADKAVDLADAEGIDNQLAAANALIGQVWALVGGHN